MPNGTYGGVRGKETKVGQKTFVSRPTRFKNKIYIVYIKYIIYLCSAITKQRIYGNDN